MIVTRIPGKGFKYHFKHDIISLFSSHFQNWEAAAAAAAAAVKLTFTGAAVPLPFFGVGYPAKGIGLDAVKISLET